MKLKPMKSIFTYKKRNEIDWEPQMLSESIVPANSYQGDTELELMEFGNAITQIGSDAFIDCTSLSGNTILNRDTLVQLNVQNLKEYICLK